MSKNTEGWGAILRGQATDIEIWVHLLNDKFEPWTETHGNDTILRSSTLNKLESADEARARALDMIDYLNGAVALSQNAGPVSFGGAIFFDSEGRITRHALIAADMGSFKVGIGRPALQAFDANGNPVPAISKPSEVQDWASVADNDSLLQEALVYFGKSPTWFNIYKALECLILRFGGGDEDAFLKLGWEPRAQLKRLKRSANMLRHAKKRFKPPKNPMTLHDANALLSKLLRRALTDALKSRTK